MRAASQADEPDDSHGSGVSAEGGEASGKLAGLGFRQVGRMDFLAYIPAIHFVQNVAEWGYIVLRTSVSFCAATVRNRGGVWQGFSKMMDSPD